MTSTPLIRRRAVLAVAAALILIGWLAWEVALVRYDWRGIHNRLAARVAAGAATFDFATETTFDWDRLFIFDGYSSKADVEDSLGFAWPAFRHSTIERSESVVLIAFVRAGKVVYWYEQPRVIELGGLANKTGYPRSEARFNVMRNGRVELTPESP